MITKTICTACEAREDRQTLIDALRSGHYRQHDRRTIYQKLRDESDNYSVTGVATAIITPMAWIKDQNHWTALRVHDIAEHAGHDALPGEDITALPPETIRHLLENAVGSVRNCPAPTATAIGIDPKNWEKNRNLQLQVNSSQIPVAKRPAFGIAPRNKGNHQLDLLSFAQAADLLANHPASVVPCRCRHPTHT